MGKKKRREAKRQQHQDVQQHERKTHVHAERVAAARRKRQRAVITWSFIAIALVFVGLLIYGLAPKPSPYTGFAACVAEQGAVMYGTDWCSHCQAQKRMFGTAFKNVQYVNCDYSQACKEQGVTGYPTWIFGDGSRETGAQPLALIAEKTGCALPDV